MTHLILKRAKLSRPSGQWSDNDFDVLADGKVVGRIYERGAKHDPPGLRWFWSITEIVPAMLNKTNGYAATREEAMTRFFAPPGRRQKLVVPLRPATTAAAAFGPALHKA